MDIFQIKNAYTHAGAFHTDDVISTVFVKKLNPSVNVHRVLDAPEGEFCFDIGHGEFDHHQKDRKINRFGVPFCSFGLLWQKYGRHYLQQLGFCKTEQAFERFEETVVSKIDQGDNFGYKEVYAFFENDMIKAFLPNWYEQANKGMTYDKQFAKAVEFADKLFDNWMRTLFERVELGDIEYAEWQRAKQNAKDGIVVLDKNIPWRFLQKISPIDNLLFVITQSSRGGYAVSAVDSKVCGVTQSDYLHFVHPSHFTGCAHTLDNAILAAMQFAKSA